MGTVFTLTIEACTNRSNDWTRIAAFELGKAYELLELDWIQVREELSAEARAKSAATTAGAAARSLGYVFSRCPRCAGDLDGSQPCERAGMYDGEGNQAPDDAEARALLDQHSRERWELLEREPWRVGPPEPWGYEDERHCCGVRDVASVIGICAASLAESAGRDGALLAFEALLVALERVAKSPMRVRCVLWGE